MTDSTPTPPEHTDERWSELKEKAQAAIEADKTHTGLYAPGVWHVVEYGDDQSPGICVHSGDAWRVCFMATIQSRKDYEQQMAKAQHIAAANPETVLALIAENERLDAECDEQMRSLEQLQHRVTTTTQVLANERDALRSRVAELEGALKPFVSFANAMLSSYEDHPDGHKYVIFGKLNGDVSISIGDLRTARAARSRDGDKASTLPPKADFDATLKEASEKPVNPYAAEWLGMQEDE